MPKNTSTIVVRPVKRGAVAASKTLLGTMSELNHHAPLAEIAPHLVCEDPKPWRQPSRLTPRRARGGRRNAGRDDGRTWVSGRFVCGTAVDADWDLELDGLDDLEGASDASDVSEYEDQCEERGSGRLEVGLLDIAKPARLRGTAREYEMVPSVSRVITLADDDPWVTVEVDDLPEAEWQRVGSDVGAKVQLQKSYAAALRAY